MKNLRFILLLILLTAASAWGAEKTVVAEGLLLDGVAGVVRKVDKVDVWQFIPTEATELSDETPVAANKPLSLLPCSVLEQITTLAGDETEIEVRLWALYTEYNQHNYLYCVFFLPMSSQPAPADEDKNNDASKEKEESIIPSDILRQIRSNTTPDLKRFEQVAKVTGDVNLIGKAGYLKQAGKLKYFQPDAFGRKVDPNQYRLLPCAMLKTAERSMTQSPGRKRYNVSGLVTVYKGRRYILMRRAVRTHTHGNFTP